MYIGFLINPIAGMGGKVGLKGTDGVVEEAIKRGAKPVAPLRAREFLSSLSIRMNFMTCGGEMGENVLEDFHHGYEVVYECSSPTSAEDTKKCCREFLRRNASLIVFCGGDGTARDVLESVGKSVPILGVPTGVKMYSSVFGLNPRACAELVEMFLNGRCGIGDGEVMDVDEDAMRRGEMRIRVFGVAKTLSEPLVQSGKMVIEGMDEERSKLEIAKFVQDFMEDGCLYILGSGSTVAKIAEVIGVEKTIFGIDAVKDGRLVGKDLSEEELLKLLEGEDRAKIIVSPIGAQGFLFGRGNQQISDRVIRKVGAENIIIVATPQKLARTPYLYVDTGDDELNRMLCGRRRVVCGYGIAQLKEVRC